MKHAKMAITLFSVVTILLAGCESKDDRIAEMEVSGVEAMIRDAGVVLNDKWNHAEKWGYDMANTIRTNADPVVRRRLSNLYINQLGKICVLDCAPSDWAKRLYNYRHILMSVDSLQSELDDAEAPFKLMLGCIRQYDDAIRQIRLLASSAATGSETWRSTAKIARELNDDFVVFSSFLKNLYMPTAAKLRLTEDRYEFWMREIGTAIDIQGHTNTTVNLPDGR